jgi:hypothetical protein
MSMRTNLAAWTKPQGAFPEFVSINYDPTTGFVHFDARGPAETQKGYPETGAQGSLSVPFDEAREMLQAAVAKLSGIEGAKRARAR